MILRARVVFPVSSPPVENGVVEVRRGVIHAIGKWDSALTNRDETVDLGEVLLFPGFVNAHCHLDYTSMAGKLPPPGSFPDWIKLILSLKAHYSYTDYAASWMLGARQLLETGTTSVADCEAVPELLAEVLPATPLKIFSFLEMTGVRSGRSGAQAVREALDLIESLPPEFRGRAGFSPHAAYSTYPDLLEATAAESRDQGRLVMSHVAESKSEWDMFTERSGPLFDWLKKQRRMEDCGASTPLEQFARRGLLNNRFLAVHANYLSDQDMDSLAAQCVSVIHCPRSHSYFGHAPFPFVELRKRGVNICLGTDSLASVRGQSRGLALSMFEEMSAFASVHPDVNPFEIVSMATTNGGKALGHENDLGGLAAGTAADFAAIPFTGSAKDAAAAIVNHQGKVNFSMIDGCYVHPPR